MQEILFWFRNDLRLHDNEALLQATEMGPVLPVYVIDPTIFRKTKLGFKKTGAFRARFLLESLADLRQGLRAKGADLIIRVGDPAKELARIAEEREVMFAVASKEVTQEETTREFELSQQMKRLNVDMDLVWGATLYHVRDLPFQIKFLPDVFTDFRKIMDKRAAVRELKETPKSIRYNGNIEVGEIPSLTDLGFEEHEAEGNTFFSGGETAALARLEEFVWKSQKVVTYKETRNGFLGDDFSSKLSAWLSLGCISPRKIYHEIRRFENEVLKNDSTYWVIFELIWRDYFHLVALKYGIRLFKTCGIQHDLEKTWRQDKVAFERWKTGKTGVPMIDANMRELNQTGFMSNRGRQLVASYFTKDLQLEWWWGAMYFESLLIDFDVCSNWGNWNYIAGIGNDPRPNRYFNIPLQGEKYDEEARYIKHWVPELAGLQAEKIHHIHKETAESLSVSGIRYGIDYPEPLQVLS
jgi:deoxyribodipyrimidine photo-lyase